MGLETHLTHYKIKLYISQISFQPQDYFEICPLLAAFCIMVDVFHMNDIEINDLASRNLIPTEIY